MERPIRCSLMLLAAVFIVPSGCFSVVGSSRQPASLPVRVLYESNFCSGGDSVPKLRVFDSAEQLPRDVFNRDRTRVDHEQPQGPEVDLESERVVLVSMGQKRTGGFRVSLGQAQAVVADKTVRITLIWTRPSEDDVVAQVLTHPCILLAIAKGDYSRIIIIDPDGKRLFETDLSAF